MHYAIAPMPVYDDDPLVLLSLQLCDLRQPSAASCSNCGVDFGQYACMSCNFFDDDVSKKQFQ
jgi:hypothetical protein